GGEHAVRPAVEDAQPQRRVARRLAGAVEAEVLLAVVAAHFRPAIAEHLTELAMVLRTGQPELQLRLDRAVALRPPWHAVQRKGLGRAFSNLVERRDDGGAFVFDEVHARRFCDLPRLVG